MNMALGTEHEHDDGGTILSSQTSGSSNQHESEYTNLLFLLYFLLRTAAIHGVLMKNFDETERISQIFTGTAL